MQAPDWIVFIRVININNGIGTWIRELVSAHSSEEAARLAVNEVNIERYKMLRCTVIPDKGEHRDKYKIVPVDRFDIKFETTR